MTQIQVGTLLIRMVPADAQQRKRARHVPGLPTRAEPRTGGAGTQRFADGMLRRHGLRAPAQTEAEAAPAALALQRSAARRLAVSTRALARVQRMLGSTALHAPVRRKPRAAAPPRAVRGASGAGRGLGPASVPEKKETGGGVAQAAEGRTDAAGRPLVVAEAVRAGEPATAAAGVTGERAGERPAVAGSESAARPDETAGAREERVSRVAAIENPKAAGGTDGDKKPVSGERSDGAPAAAALGLGAATAVATGGVAALDGGQPEPQPVAEPGPAARGEAVRGEDVPASSEQREGEPASGSLHASDEGAAAVEAEAVDAEGEAVASGGAGGAGGQGEAALAGGGAGGGELDGELETALPAGDGEATLVGGAGGIGGSGGLEGEGGAGGAALEGEAMVLPAPGPGSERIGPASASPAGAAAAGGPAADSAQGTGKPAGPDSARSVMASDDTEHAAAHVGSSTGSGFAEGAEAASRKDEAPGVWAPGAQTESRADEDGSVWTPGVAAAGSTAAGAGSIAAALSQQDGGGSESAAAASGGIGGALEAGPTAASSETGSIAASLPEGPDSAEADADAIAASLEGGPAAAEVDAEAIAATVEGGSAPAAETASGGAGGAGGAGELGAGGAGGAEAQAGAGEGQGASGGESPPAEESAGFEPGLEAADATVEGSGAAQADSAGRGAVAVSTAAAEDAAPASDTLPQRETSAPEPVLLEAQPPATAGSQGEQGAQGQEGGSGSPAAATTLAAGSAVTPAGSAPDTTHDEAAPQKQQEAGSKAEAGPRTVGAARLAELREEVRSAVEEERRAKAALAQARQVAAGGGELARAELALAEQWAAWVSTFRKAAELRLAHAEAIEAAAGKADAETQAKIERLAAQVREAQAQEKRLRERVEALRRRRDALRDKAATAQQEPAAQEASASSQPAEEKAGKTESEAAGGPGLAVPEPRSFGDKAAAASLDEVKSGPEAFAESGPGRDEHTTASAVESPSDQGPEPPSLEEAAGGAKSEPGLDTPDMELAAPAVELEKPVVPQPSGKDEYEEATRGFAEGPPSEPVIGPAYGEEMRDDELAEDARLYRGVDETGPGWNTELVLAKAEFTVDIGANARALEAEAELAEQRAFHAAFRMSPGLRQLDALGAVESEEGEGIGPAPAARDRGRRPRPRGDGMGMPIPEDLKRRIEAVTGRAVDPRVRIHVGQQAAQAAQALEARAFTVGTNIYFGEGEWNPDTPEGFALLVHEVTHTTQHLEGRDRSGKPRRSEPETARQSRWAPALDRGTPKLPDRLRRAMRGVALAGEGAERGGAALLQRKSIFSRLFDRLRTEVRSDKNQRKAGRELGKLITRRAGGGAAGTIAGGLERIAGDRAGSGLLGGLLGGLRGKRKDAKKDGDGAKKQQLEAEAERNEAAAKRRMTGPGTFSFLQPPPKSPLSLLLGKDQDKDVEVPRTPENYLKRFMDYFHVRKSMREDEFVDMLAERVMDLLEEELVTERERRQPNPW